VELLPKEKDTKYGITLADDGWFTVMLLPVGFVIVAASEELLSWLAIFSE
jgi:hypothetical protein